MRLHAEHSRQFTVKCFRFFTIGADLGRVLATDPVIQPLVERTSDSRVTINHGNYLDLFALGGKPRPGVSLPPRPLLQMLTHERESHRETLIREGLTALGHRKTMMRQVVAKIPQENARRVTMEIGLDLCDVLTHEYRVFAKVPSHEGALLINPGAQRHEDVVE